MNEPNRTPTGELACAFGWPWMEHEPHVPPLLACPDCRDESDRPESEDGAEGEASA